MVFAGVRSATGIANSASSVNFSEVSLWTNRAFSSGGTTYGKIFQYRNYIENPTDNYINTEGWSTGKGYFHERIRSMGNILLTMVAITAALVFMSYGGKVIELLTDNPNLWLYLRWPIALLMFFMIISVYYYALPEKKVRIREIIPGSIFASVGLLAVTFVYSIYTSSIANYDIIYGSLATVVALMFWFFFLAWVFCLGMIFNKVWKDTKKK